MSHDRSHYVGSGGVAPEDPNEFQALGGEKFDVIISADVMYEPEFAVWLPLLANRCALLYPRSKIGDMSTVCFLTSAPTREMGILNALVNNLAGLGFGVTVISATERSSKEAPNLCHQQSPSDESLVIDAVEGEDCLIVKAWWSNLKP